MPTLLVALATAAPASAQTTVLDFEGLPEDRAQAAAAMKQQGVEFGQPHEFGGGFDLPHETKGCGPGHIRKVGSGHVLVATYACTGSGEFMKETALFMRFTRPRTFVQARIDGGPINGASPVTLTAYDANRNKILQRQVVPQGTAGPKVGIDVGDPRIVYLDIWTGQLREPDLEIDDLTFDVPPAGTGTPAIGAKVSRASLEVGGTVDVPVELTRYGAAESQSIHLAASGLPPGVSVQQIVPNPVPAGTDQATIRLAATGAAALGSATIKVTATAGGVAAVVDLPIDVSRSYAPSAAALAIARCDQQTLEVAYRLSSYDKPVRVEVTTAAAGLTVSPAVQTLASGGTASVRFAASQAIPDAAAFTVRTSAAGQPVREETYPVTRAPAEFFVSTPFAGNMPLLRLYTLKPLSIGQADSFSVLGRGLCPGSTVQIGHARGRATQVNFAADGSGGTVAFPATTREGDLTVTLPGGEQLPPRPRVRVSSLRNVWGLPMQNAGTGDLVWGDAVAVFGHDETYWSSSLGIKNPYAVTWFDLNKGVGGGGNCWGFASTTIQFIQSGYATLSQSATVSPAQLGSPSGPFQITNQGGLWNVIRRRQLAQKASEMVKARARFLQSVRGPGGATTAAALRVGLENALKGGPAILGFRNADNSSGHAVVALGVRTTPTGYDVDVYNPNTPYAAAEEANEAAAATADANSTFSVNAATNTYSFPELNWSAGLGRVYALPAFDATRDQLTTPSRAETETNWVSGSGGAKLVEVQDAKGRRVDLSGERQSEIPGASVDVPDGIGSSPRVGLPRSTTVRFKVRPDGTAPFTASALAPALVVQVSGRRLTGELEVTAEPDGRVVLSGAKGAADAVDVRLWRRVGGAWRLVTAHVPNPGAAHTGLRLTGSGVTVDRSGPAARVGLQLGALAGGAAPSSVAVGAASPRAGRRLVVRARSWRALTPRTVAARLGRKTLAVRLPAAARRLQVPKPTTSPRRDGTLVTGLRGIRAPRGASITVSWTIRRAGKVLASHLVELGRTAKTATWAPPRSVRGRVRVSTAIAVGNSSAGHPIVRVRKAARTVKLRARR